MQSLADSLSTGPNISNHNNPNPTAISIQSIAKSLPESVIETECAAYRWKNGNQFENRSGVNGQHLGVNHVVQLANLLPTPFDQTIRDQTDYIVDESMSNLQNDYGPNSSKRRFRTSFTEQQSQFLEDSFQESHYPDQKAKRGMASALKLPEDRITDKERQRTSTTPQLSMSLQYQSDCQIQSTPITEQNSCNYFNYEQTFDSNFYETQYR
ncbi:hypothetical protein WR25_07159 [Diploscapter pachys]|uniref:Homeobox domain-containing protein n=1 Tax=Diploscapter pachys TaxID=2018661 RepID=A0A2A2J1X3_9BILA|nr:hypothetical protein WR25_07159 [Diploscapter pachys]